MDLPPLPPVVPGRSALAAFLPVEVGIREALAGERERAARQVREAEEEGVRIRREGEERLKRVVVEAQDRALREAEDRARDRVSRVRARTQRWVEEAEAAARDAMGDALDLCCDA